MADCICDFAPGCQGTGILTCSGCGGDQCVCVCGFGCVGEMDCPGCEDCEGES